MVIQPDAVLITTLETKPLPGFPSLEKTLESYHHFIEGVPLALMPKEQNGTSPIKIAVEFARQLGVCREEIDALLPKIAPEVWQTEMWKTEKKVTIINDTVAEDPQSIVQSLRAYPPLNGEKESSSSPA